jgi:PEP-CTERM motif
VSKPLFTLALLASAFILPRAAHADTIDNFRITGDGNTITFFLPASPTDVFALPQQNYTLTTTREPTPPAVPEPSALLLLATGASCLLYRATKRPAVGAFL